MNRSRTITDERPAALDSLLLTLVRSARTNERPVAPTRRELVKTAKRRRRRSAAASGMAGPLAPVALQLSELLEETRVVCELDRVHGLGLSDEAIGAHMLVLWSLAADLPTALAAIEGRDGRTVAGLLRQRLADVAGSALPDRLTKRAVVTAVWQVRRVAREGVKRGPGAVARTVVRPGPATRQFIERAELQLGVG